MANLGNDWASRPRRWPGDANLVGSLRAIRGKWVRAVTGNGVPVTPSNALTLKAQCPGSGSTGKKGSGGLRRQGPEGARRFARRATGKSAGPKESGNRGDDEAHRGSSDREACQRLDWHGGPRLAWPSGDQRSHARILQIAKRADYSPNWAAQSLSVGQGTLRLGVCIARTTRHFSDQARNGIGNSGTGAIFPFFSRAHSPRTAVRGRPPNRLAP